MVVGNLARPSPYIASFPISRLPVPFDLGLCCFLHSFKLVSSSNTWISSICNPCRGHQVYEPSCRSSLQHKMVSGRVVLALLLLVSAVNAEVVTLTDATYAVNVNADILWFVKFHATWCPWSQRLAPAWEQLGSDVDVREAGVKVGAVDCETSKATCLKENVQGYPTLTVFYNGEKVDHDYYGNRDMESLKAFVLQQHAKLKAAVVAKPNATDEMGLHRDQSFSVGMLLKLLGF